MAIDMEALGTAVMCQQKVYKHLRIACEKAENKPEFKEYFEELREAQAYVGAFLYKITQLVDLGILPSTNNEAYDKETEEHLATIGHLLTPAED